MGAGNLYSLLRRSYPADLGKDALVVPGARTYSWRELDALVGRLANVLRQRGLEPGDRVAVQADKSPEAVALYLACLKAGLVYLPLNTAYTKAEVAYFLEDAEPGLFVDNEVLGTLVATAAPDEGPAHPAGPDDLAALCYTSGTTGRAKGAMLTHRNLASNAQTLHRVWGFRPGDVLLHALPIFHVHGLFVALHTALLNGSTMLFLPKFDAKQVLELLQQATVMMGVPTFYTRLLDEPGLTAERCRHMRLFVSGSAPLLAETHRQFEERSGQAILERYGMTETGMLASNPLDGPRRAGTVGLPLPDVELRIAGEDGKALPQGQVGSVEVRGPNVFPGYWRRPGQREKDFRSDGFFITGDVGVIEPDGYLALVGRAKDLIISGGYNVYPKEIELVLDTIEGIGESAVVGLPHRDFGEGVTAFCTTNGTPPNEAEVLAQCRHTLASYKMPKRVLFVETLPRNAMGKVQKAKLREQHSGLYAT
jgi:malonyl-CoA/methylmalonyl-CoA synthetase